MKQTKKQEYEAPKVEQIEARVEKGFAGTFVAGSQAGDPISDDGPTYDGDALFS